MWQVGVWCTAWLLSISVFACGDSGGPATTRASGDSGEASAGEDASTDPGRSDGGLNGGTPDGGATARDDGGADDAGSDGDGAAPGEDAGANVVRDDGGGADALADQAACEAATQIYADGQMDWDRAADQCEDLGFDPRPERRLVNPSGIDFAQEVQLDRPMPAGVSSAVSLRLQRQSTAGTFEIWGGSGEACGAVNELLWWTDIESRRVCAEFVPSQQTTRLLVAWRQQERLRGIFDFSIGDIAICPSGSCPGDGAGQGLSPGKKLSAPAGFYTWLASPLPWATGMAATLGDYQEGAFVMRYASSWQGEEARALADGIVRMSPYDPFGDAWYCLGDGSTFTSSEIYGHEAHSIQLRSLSRLVSCDGASGSGTASITIASDPNFAQGAAQIDARGTDFAMADAEMDGSCSGARCDLQFAVDVPTVSDMRVSALYVQSAGDLGNWYEPTLQTADITSAAWIYLPAQGGAPKVACASGGRIHYDPKGTTTISLSGVTEAATCPGEPVSPNQFDVRLE